MITNSTILAVSAADLVGFYSFPKLAAMAVLFIGWVFVCQWVDRDTDFVKTKREQWNLIVLSGGIAGFGVFILSPFEGNLFFLGLGFFVLLAGGGAVAYVVHRNGRVVKQSRVMTWGHLKRTLAREGGAKQEKSDKGIRVMVEDTEGKTVKRGLEAEQAEAFDHLQDLLFDAFWRRATDVDLIVGAEQVRLIYRIDGVPMEQPNGSFTPESGERIITYVKGLAGLNPEERRRPQHGTIKAAPLAEAADMKAVQVTASGSTAGERLHLRFQTEAELKRIHELGLAEPRLKKLEELIKLPSGLMIFAGPRGSGVTTTQYAVMRAHDAFMQNLHTIEKSPAAELDNITQHVYKGDNPEVSYARQLQTVIRREPDVVLVGECEDRDTAGVALKAAQDEKKIYLAIEAGDCTDGLARFLALAEDTKAVGKVLVGVMAQRLIRLLCPTCRQSYRPDEKLLKKANLPVGKIDTFYRQPTEPIYDKKGREIVCQTCQGSGYVGRTGVFELMVVDKNIRSLIAQGAAMKMVKAAARKNRMYYLQEEGLLKVIDGTTSLNEVLRGLRVDSQ